MITPLLSLIGIAPLLFFLVDGYYEKNVKRGINQVVAFALAMGFAVAMLYIIGWYFALCAPIFIVALLVFNHIKNHGK